MSFGIGVGDVIAMVGITSRLIEACHASSKSCEILDSFVHSTTELGERLEAALATSAAPFHFTPASDSTSSFWDGPFHGTSKSSSGSTPVENSLSAVQYLHYPAFNFLSARDYLHNRPFKFREKWVPPNRRQSPTMEIEAEGGSSLSRRRDRYYGPTTNDTIDNVITRQPRPLTSQAPKSKRTTDSFYTFGRVFARLAELEN